MKTISKVLSMFLVVVMCFGLFSTSAFATNFDFGQNDAAAAPAAAPAAGNDGFDFQGNSSFSSTASDSFTPNNVEFNDPAVAAPAASDSFNLNENAAAEAKTENNNTLSASQTFEFETAYEDKSDADKKDVKVEITEAVFSKSDPKDITINKAEFDTFTRFKYVKGTNFDYADYMPDNAMKRESTSLKINKDWLLQRETGYYTIWGILNSNGMPIELGHIQINPGSYSEDTKWKAEIYNSPYIKPGLYDTTIDWDDPITATGEGISNCFKKGGFGIAAVSGGYTHILASSEYIVSGNYLELDRKYLNTLSDGDYYLIGFPVEYSTSEQVRLGRFSVVSSNMDDALGFLTPDGQVWYGGTDPLTFYCDIFDAAGRNWNYKGYGWDVIVPDIRVSTRSDMVGATSVRIDQYWDLEYGYFMLGTNYLNSLSAEHTYYMQVVDARHPNMLYSNVVSFRVGPTLRALDTDKHVINSTRSLRFRSSAPVARVYVGNIELTDPADFGVSWDGQTVTLSYEFLNKRSGGNTYTIKVLTTSGEYASTTFQVLTTAQGSASPRTGDESNLGLWAAFLLLSGTAIVVMVPKLRKHE